MHCAVLRIPIFIVYETQHHETKHLTIQYNNNKLGTKVYLTIDLISIVDIKSMI